MMRGKRVGRSAAVSWGASASVLALVVLLGACAANDGEGGKAGAPCASADDCRGLMVCDAGGVCAPPARTGSGAGSGSENGAGEGGAGASDDGSGGAGEGEGAGDPGGVDPEAAAACADICRKMDACGGLEAASFGDGVEGCEGSCGPMSVRPDFDEVIACLNEEVETGGCSEEGIEICFSTDDPSIFDGQPGGPGNEDGGGDMGGGMDGSGSGPGGFGGEGEGEGEFGGGGIGAAGAAEGEGEGE